VTAAVPFGASLVRPPAPDGGVAVDPPVAGRSTFETPKASGPVSIDFARLPVGDAPSVPYYADGVIHDGDQRVPFAGFTYVSDLVKVANGYAVVADRGPGGPGSGNLELFLVRPDGTRLSVGRGMIFRPAVSEDGRRMAWSTFSGTTEAYETTLHLTDTSTGATVAERSLGLGEETLAAPRAILGSTVVVERATNAASRPLRAWHPGSNTLTTWYDGYGLAGVSADLSKVAVSQASSTHETCFDLVALPSMERAWRSCDYDHWSVAFAPDGGHLLTASARVDRAPEDRLMPLPEPRAMTTVESDLYVLDASSGKRVLQIKNQQPLQRTWESADTFLFEATDGTQTALVRCTLGGSCELATPPIVLEAGLWGTVTLAARHG
jgi:hypothetical protein